MPHDPCVMVKELIVFGVNADGCQQKNARYA